MSSKASWVEDQSGQADSPSSVWLAARQQISTSNRQKHRTPVSKKGTGIQGSQAEDYLIKTEKE